MFSMIENNTADGEVLLVIAAEPGLQTLTMRRLKDRLAGATTAASTCEALLDACVFALSSDDLPVSFVVPFVATIYTEFTKCLVVAQQCGKLRYDSELASILSKSRIVQNLLNNM